MSSGATSRFSVKVTRPALRASDTSGTTSDAGSNPSQRGVPAPSDANANPPTATSPLPGGPSALVGDRGGGQAAPALGRLAEAVGSASLQRPDRSDRSHRRAVAIGLLEAEPRLARPARGRHNRRRISLGVDVRGDAHQHRCAAGPGARQTRDRCAAAAARRPRWSSHSRSGEVRWATSVIASAGYRSRALSRTRTRARAPARRRAGRGRDCWTQIARNMWSLVGSCSMLRFGHRSIRSKKPRRTSWSYNPSPRENSIRPCVPCSRRRSKARSISSLCERSTGLPALERSWLGLIAASAVFAWAAVRSRLTSRRQARPRRAPERLLGVALGDELGAPEDRVQVDHQRAPDAGVGQCGVQRPVRARAQATEHEPVGEARARRAGRGSPASARCVAGCRSLRRARARSRRRRTRRSRACRSSRSARLARPSGGRSRPTSGSGRYGAARRR